MFRTLARFALPAVVAVALPIAGCSPANPSPTPLASGGSSAGSPLATSTAGPPTPSPLGFTPGTAANPRVVTMTTDDFLNFTPGVVTIAEGETITFKIQQRRQG